MSNAGKPETSLPPKLTTFGLYPCRAPTLPVRIPPQQLLACFSLCCVMNKPSCLFISVHNVVLHTVYHSCLGLTVAAAPTVATMVNSVCVQLRVWGSAFLWVTAFLRWHHLAHLRGCGWWEFPWHPWTSSALALQLSAELLCFPHPTHTHHAPDRTASILVGPCEPHHETMCIQCFLLGAKS